MLPADLDREPLRQFAVGVFPQSQSPQPLPGDAGLRRYYRLDSGQAAPSTAILVDSRADSGAAQRFIRLTHLLSQAQLPVPQIYAAHPAGEYLLIEDLGDDCLDAALAADADAAMPPLLALLGDWQTKTAGLKNQLPDYSAAVLQEEFSRCPRWFFPEFLQRPLTAAESAALDEESARLIAMIKAQDSLAVHRDFHCRNLMRRPDGSVAIIDYQDALWGAQTYDLVSLTRDCYVRYSRAQRLAWEEAFRRRHHPQIDAADWQKACHAQSLQRHVKILGLFVRLALQEGKPRYLTALPQVWADVLWESAALAAELPRMAQFFSDLNPAAQARFAERGL